MAAVQLAVAECGAGPPVAILHGLFGSGRNWRSIAQQLASCHRVLALDLRNHGASPWADGMSYLEMVDDLRASLQQHGIGRASLMGHSMGGKVAMLAALLHPDEVDHLVVVDIAPVSNPPILVGHIRAMRDIDLRAATRRGDVDAQLGKAIPDAADRAFLLQNLVIADGNLRWRLNLEAIERGFAEILGFPSLPAGTAYRGPTLFVAGANSGYIRADDKSEIRRRFPQARVIRVKAAGHWVHAEQPQAFLQTVAPFLRAPA